MKQDYIKMLLWLGSSLAICLIFIVFALFISVSYFKSTPNSGNLSLFIFTFAGFILFTYIYIILLSDFFFVHTYITNKKVVITKTFSKKVKEIPFKDIEHCFSFAYTSVCIKKADKKYCIGFIKNPDTLVAKIIEQSNFSISTPIIYKNKINEYLLSIFLTIPFLLLYFVLLFNINHIKSFYYQYQGNRHTLKCHSSISIEECKKLKNSAEYKKSITTANYYYLKALEYEPNNILLYDTLYKNYRDLKQYNKAILILKSALLTNPQYSEIF